MSTKKNALAQSIKTLLGPPQTAKKAPAKAAVPEAISLPEPSVEGSQTVRILRIDSIVPNPRQPRKFFDPAKLEELAQSIKRHGILQPIVVTSGSASGAGFTLLAGERRWRAAQAAGLAEIPAQVIEATDAQLLELSIVENVQRDDLNPVEEAEAYRELMTQFAWTQEEIAERVGKRRPTVANALRLLQLEEDMLEALRQGKFTPGHARALLAIPDKKLRRRLFNDIMAADISVREAERRAIQVTQPERKASPAKKSGSMPAEDIDIDNLRQRLVDRLGCPVRVRRDSATSGSIEIQWQTLDDLDRVLELLDLND